MKISNWMWGLMLASVVASCGGSGGQDFSAQADTASKAPVGDLISGESSALASSRYGIAAEGGDRALMLRKLSAHFNGRFAGQPESLMGTKKTGAGPVASQKVTKSVAGSPVGAVHRFFNTLAGVHFYTISEAEKARVMQSLPHYNYEGQAFFALQGEDAPLSPVFRFYSIYTGTHFYTIDPDERDYVLENYSMYFNFEGVAWFATTHAGPGWIPMHRFYNTGTGTHFYTTSAEEIQRVIATEPYMEYEGIGYFVRADGAARPVSPISNSAAGGGCLSPTSTYENLSCEGADELPLKAHVEGNREFDVPNERFVALPGQATSDCTQDKVTGLVWETKDSNPGHRWMNRKFTHFDRTDRLQVVETFPSWIAAEAAFKTLSIPRVPTQSEIDSSDNSKAYVDYVNGIALCGYADWRIPTASELVNVVSFGGESYAMPNSGTGPYLSSDPVTFQYDGNDSTGQAMRYTLDGVVAVGNRAREPNRQNSNGDLVTFEPRSGSFTVGYAAGRNLVLVRGTVAPTQSRFTTATLPYGRDASNNVVIDSWSKLQWRRCLEGEVWNGVACNGQPLALNLYDALARAAAYPGWRLPGIKELDSIHSRRSDSSSVQWDANAFPSPLGSDSLGLWSMSRHWRPIEDQGRLGLPGYQVFFGGVGPGVPAAGLSLMSRNKLGYARMIRVHP